MEGVRLEFESSLPMGLSVRIERYLNRHGMTAGGPSGAYDGEMEGWLWEARAMLPERDREFLRRVPVFTMPGFCGEMTQWEGAEGKAVRLTTAITDGRGIAIYPAALRELRPEYGAEEYVDWLRRLLLHEIGHARDNYSDHFMAKEYGY